MRDDERIPREAVLESLDDFAAKGADLIVEVAHPDISRTHGAAFLRHADYMVGSPTAFADAEVERSLRAAAEDESTPFGMYIPSGALWGAKDIQKAAARGTVAFLSVTMKKHPSSLKVQGELQGRLDEAVRSGREGETVLYDGPVRGLCPLAPNNVNTMACAAMAAPSLGFDGTRAVLVCDPSLEAHVIDIEMRGPKKSDDEEPFSVATRRYNPAKPGACRAVLPPRTQRVYDGRKCSFCACVQVRSPAPQLTPASSAACWVPQDRAQGSTFADSHATMHSLGNDGLPISGVAFMS